MKRRRRKKKLRRKMRRRKERQKTRRRRRKRRKKRNRTVGRQELTGKPTNQQTNKPTNQQTNKPTKGERTSEFLLFCSSFLHSFFYLQDSKGRRQRGRKGEMKKEEAKRNKNHLAASCLFLSVLLFLARGYRYHQIPRPGWTNSKGASKKTKEEEEDGR